MRRVVWTVFFATSLFAAGSALAEKVVVEADLKEKPSARARTLAALLPGVEVLVERPGGEWSLVSVDGVRGYIASAMLAPFNPNCDLGYPYSGSSPYFGGLTELRASAPLGALFGYHTQRPC